MLRGFRVLVCTSLAAGLSAQTPAGELNKELPKWLRFGADYRARIEGFAGGGFRDGNDDAYLLQRVRINMRIQPTSWLKVVFQGQDARVFWNDRIAGAPPYRDTMDLRLGYLELGDPESRPVSLRAGRQELVFGDQRLVGHTNWSNTARSFDAVRATFRHKGYRLDAFAASVVALRSDEFNRSVTGNNLHGLYGSIEKLVPQATVEPYVLWRIGNLPGLPHQDFHTIGARWVGKLPSAFDYGVEMAAQSGRYGAEKMRAWAGHWVVGYTASGARYTPRLSAEYNYASGDRAPNDGRRGTFDELYPTAHDKYGLADQVGWRNIHDLRFGIDCKPSSKWQLIANYHDWWLASPRDGLYNAPGNLIVRVPDGSAGRHVGQELDLQALYAPSKQVQIGAGVGHIFPGEFLAKATPGKAFTYPFLVLAYSF